jgi:tripartite ATP-independent transporter DctM subunit
MFGGLLVLMLGGVPVAFAFLFVNIAGVIFFWGGEAGLRQLTLSIFDSVTSWVLLPVPLFVLMGEVMFHSGAGFRMMDALDKWMGRLPGRLSLLTVAGGTLFSTLSGSSMANTALMGSILAPKMESYGYHRSMTLGPILGSAGLAILIPPSALAVVLASLAEISVGRTLIGGVVPGLVMGFFYASYVIGRCWLQPSLAPAYEVARTPLSEKIAALVRDVLPLGLIIFLVLGLIFLGIASPTESAALGALGTFILAALYGRLNWEVVKTSVSATLQVTVMIFMILTASTAYSQILAFSGASESLTEFAVGLPLPPIMVLIVMQVVLLFLGMFMDQISMMMITIPVYMPIVHALGFNPIWFAVMMLLNLEIGTTSPPFGVLLFVMKGVAPPGTTMGEIYRAALPFILCDLAVMALMLAFPALVLWLPSLMLS